MKKVVIFDFDGTLADTISLAVRLYNDHAAHFGSLPITASDIPLLRQTIRDEGYAAALRLKKVRYSRLPSLVVTVSRDMKAHMPEVQPFTGIIVALEELKAKGYRLGVLTSNQEHLVREFLESHSYPLFDFIVSEKTLFGKDKALRRIVKKFGLLNNEVVYVGDETRDTSACIKAGIDVIGVAWGVAGADGFARAMPNKIILDPTELVAAIEAL